MLVGIAKQFFVAVATKGTLDEYMNYGNIADLFKNQEADEFVAFDSHVKKYAAIPSMELVNKWFGSSKTVTPEPPAFYLEKLRNRYFDALLSKSVDGANKLLQKDKAEEAALYMMSEIAPALLKRHGNRLIDFRDAYEIVMAAYFQQFKQGDDYGIKLGYPVVDEYGGLIGGDVLSLVGRPAAGKSFITLRGAHRVWSTQKKSPAFISMEMNNLISAQRLVAMDGGIPLSNLKLQKGQGLTTAQLGKLKAAQGKAKSWETPFHLMDGNLSTTVEDVYSFCRQMKPSVLFIDGAYMLKHPNSRLGRFERVAENCELLKQEIAGNLGIPVVASWQFSREAAKKKAAGKQGQKIGLEDIGYSDAIGQISSIVLGLLDEETVESLIRKVVTIMKGRNGETGQFQINWLFNPLMNFDMYVPEAEDEMQFV